MSNFYCVLPGHWAKDAPALIENLKDRGVNGIRQRQMNRDRFLEMANVGGMILCVSGTEIHKLLATADGQPYIQYKFSKIFFFEHPESFIDELSGKRQWVEV